jgi:hypothetical protein
VRRLHVLGPSVGSPRTGIFHNQPTPLKKAKEYALARTLGAAARPAYGYGRCLLSKFKVLVLHWNSPESSSLLISCYFGLYVSRFRSDYGAGGQLWGLLSLQNVCVKNPPPTGAQIGAIGLVSSHICKSDAAALLP